MRSRRTLIVLTFVALQGVGIVPLVEGQFRKGFTQSTTEVVLNRRRPPDFLILAPAIKVEAATQVGRDSATANRFQSALEGQLLANDSRLRANPARPDTLISCSITRLDSRQSAGSRTKQVTRQVGTKQVWNSKKRIYESQPNYQLVTETESYVTVQGDIAVALQVKDRKGATLDSYTFSPTYNQEFKAGNTPPSTSEVEQQLLDMGVAQVARRLTLTREPLTVMLARPNDPIDDINKLGQAGQWTAMLEQLQLIKPLKDQKKEAYRLHNLGVANEAIAYNTANVATSRKLLDDAAALYRQAVAMKPDEKYFLTPQARIGESITAYAEIDRQQKVLADADGAAALAKPDPPAASPPSKTAPPGTGPGLKTPTAGGPASSTTFGNVDVIDLVAAGLDQPNLLAAIKDAPRVSFDLSPAGLKQLLAGKVPNPVITAMRARQTAQNAPAKKSPPPPLLENPKGAAPPPKPPAPAKPPGSR